MQYLDEHGHLITESLTDYTRRRILDLCHSRDEFLAALVGFANCEYTVDMGMYLKPQDVLVLLKMVAIGERTWSYAGLAAELGMSASEVHGAVKRITGAQLYFAETAAVFHGNVVEFLISGVRYVFPGEWGSETVGMPTAYAAPPLNELLSLVDALRIGKARERMIAADIVKARVYASRAVEVA